MRRGFLFDAPGEDNLETEVLKNCDCLKHVSVIVDDVIVLSRQILRSLSEIVMKRKKTCLLHQKSLFSDLVQR